MPVPELNDPTPASPDRRLGPSPWPWMVLACAIVAASGVVRINQESLFADAARAAETSPFSLKDLPRKLGDHWEMIGGEGELESETLQIAGCSDYMYRNYVDKRTGVALTVLVAFGPAERVFPHSPLVCFPANGYEPRGGAGYRAIALDDPEADGEPRPPAAFSALVYGKSGGGVENQQEVYYSFWHDGRWSPGAEQTQNLFRHRPAMFKIQVERPIAPGEVGGDHSPIEEFVAALVPEIERRREAAEGRAED